MIGEYAAAIAACDTLDAISEAFRAAVAREGYVSSASRAWLNGGDRPLTQSYFRNWTREWARLSDEKSFTARSPAIVEARRRLTPFTWCEIKEQRPQSASEREVWDTVQEWGFRDGFVVPVHGPGGYFATISAASTEHDLDLTGVTRRRLWMIALLTHERCLALCPFAQDDKTSELTAREWECLRWVAAGETDWEIGVILSISSATVRFHIDRARLKLGASTRSQAVARVALRGL
jgi:LuxR family transcriptional regulator, quorum-sensing system regulator BjaR1